MSDHLINAVTGQRAVEDPSTLMLDAGDGGVSLHVVPGGADDWLFLADHVGNQLYAFPSVLAEAPFEFADGLRDAWIQVSIGDEGCLGYRENSTHDYIKAVELEAEGLADELDGHDEGLLERPIVDGVELDWPAEGGSYREQVNSLAAGKADEAMRLAQDGVKRAGEYVFGRLLAAGLACELDGAELEIVNGDYPSDVKQFELWR